ncbi:hypothetical protein HMI56_000095 [Coelomomyces lativittatus]|nr:hypothetical protein HMI56_000095 [Coelomomyces lativittatus]
MAETSIARSTVKILKAENGKWNPLMNETTFLDLYFHSGKKTFRFISYTKEKKCVLNAPVNGSGAAATATCFKQSTPNFYIFNDHANRQILGFNFSDTAKATAFYTTVNRVTSGAFLKELENPLQQQTKEEAPPPPPPPPPLPLLPSVLDSFENPLSNEKANESLPPREIASTSTATSERKPSIVTSFTAGAPSSSPSPPPPPPPPPLSTQTNSMITPTSSLLTSLSTLPTPPDTTSTSQFETPIEPSGPLSSLSSSTAPSPPPPPPPPTPSSISLTPSPQSPSETYSTPLSPVSRPKPVSAMTLVEEIAYKANLRKQRQASVAATPESSSAPTPVPTADSVPSSVEVRVTKAMLDSWKQDIADLLHNELEKLKEELRTLLNTK